MSVVVREFTQCLETPSTQLPLVLLTRQKQATFWVIRYSLQCCETGKYAGIAPGKSWKMHYLSPGEP